MPTFIENIGETGSINSLIEAISSYLTGHVVI